MAFISNLDELCEQAKNNTFYRRVIETYNDTQSVVMHLIPGEDIPMEIHKGKIQFLFVFSGEGKVFTGDRTSFVNSGDIIIIPSDTEHYVGNSGKDPLKLISFYSPPEHPKNRVNERKPK